MISIRGVRGEVLLIPFCNARIAFFPPISHLHCSIVYLFFLFRCIYAYFMGVPIADLPFKDLHTHRIYELTPGNIAALLFYSSIFKVCMSRFVVSFKLRCSISLLA